MTTEHKETQAGKEPSLAQTLEGGAEEQVQPRSRFFARFRRHKLGMASVGVLLLLILVAVFAPFVARKDPSTINMALIGAPPSWEHWLGNNSIGRDVWARLIYGSRVSLSVGIFSVILYTVIGVVLGSAAGFFGGGVDMIIMRATDVLMCFPSFLLILTVTAALEPRLINIILILGFLSWTGMARLVRAQILSVKEEDYIMLARAIGVPQRRILIRHVIPNALTPVLVSAPMGVAGAIMAEAGLSFLGIGVQDPMASWGGMMSSALTLPILQNMPWRWLPPAILLSLVTLSANFAADGLRDALDPRARLG